MTSRMDTIDPKQLSVGSNFTPLNGLKEEEVEAPAPSAPQTPKTPKTPAKRKKDDKGTPTPKKSKTQTIATDRKRSQAIPDSFDDLSEEDKMMLKWKEVSWPVR